MAKKFLFFSRSFCLLRRLVLILLLRKRGDEAAGQDRDKNLQSKPAKGGISISAVFGQPKRRNGNLPFHPPYPPAGNQSFGQVQNPDFSPSSLIVSAIEGDGAPDYITLKPLEEKTVNLFLPISQYAPLNNYNLIVSYIYSDGRGLGTADKIIPQFRL